MASNQKWREVERKILAKLDIASEYQALGIELTSDRPNAGGWLACWAIDRPHGNNPSAAINVGEGELRGRYVDRGGNGDSFGLWDFAAKYGGAASWKDARKEFAKKAGLAKSLPKSDDDETLEERLEFVPTWQPILFRGLIGAYRGVTEEALRLCGGCIVKYPRKSHQPRYCVALPGYGPQLTEGPIRCYTIMPCDGGQIALYQGEGKPSEPRKRINIGPSGLLGKHGVSRLSQSPTVVWKVEGVSDLLALQAIIPPELRDTHLVVTNAGGSTEVSLPAEVAHCFAGLQVAVIHDADEPGQQGAKLWLGSLAGVAGEVRHVQLPYEIVKAHGKDLRDWLNEGRSYADLLALHSAAEAITKTIEQSPAADSACVAESATLTAHQMVLERLGIVILGEIHASRTVMAYSQLKRKMVEIKNLDKYSVNQLIMDFGNESMAYVSVGEATESKIGIDLVRRAIADEAGKRRISDRNQIGVGAWLVDDQLYLVNAGEVVCVRDDKLERYETPRIGRKLVDFGESSDNWFGFAELSSLYDKAQSREWCQAVLSRAAALFEVFESLIYKSDTRLIVSAVCASFLQTVWGFRPQIVVSGPTNCGKSWLLGKFVKPLLGDLHLTCDKPSEAGVRQAIGHTAKVVVMDEFERSAQRQQILEFIRLAARGGTITKGTNNGQRGIQFRLQHMLWMAGIENGLSDAADRNRVILINMQRPPKESSKAFSTPSTKELSDLGMELLAVTLRHWRAAEAMSRELIGISDMGFDSRLIESHATPIAIWGVVHGWSCEQILGEIISILSERSTATQEETDEGALLELILGASVVVTGGARRTVASLLDETLDPVAKDILEAYGVSPVQHRDEPGVKRIFFRQDIIKSTLLKETKWKDAQLNQILMRVRNAKDCVKKFHSGNLRGVSIPVSEILAQTESERLSQIESVALQQEEEARRDVFGP